MKTPLLSFIFFLLTQAVFSQEQEVARLLDQKKQIEQEITLLQDSLARVETRIISLQERQKAVSTTPDSNNNAEEKQTGEFSVSLDDLLANKEGNPEDELAMKERNSLDPSEDMEEFPDESGLQAVNLDISEVEEEEKEVPAPTLRRNELLAKEKLFIRLGPDNESKVVLELEKNTIVWKIDEIGDYTLVCHEGTCGYVPGKSVGKELEPEL